MHCLGYKTIKSLGLNSLRSFVIYFLEASTNKDKPLLELRKYLF